MKYEILKDEIKNAMKAKDNNRRDILRMVHTELKTIEVDERREVEEADVNAMLKRVIKQTMETLEASIKAGNDQDRTDKLTEQVEILKSYMPAQVEGPELEALVDETIAELEALTKKDMRSVMGTLVGKTGGNMDKASAAKMVSSRLS